MHNTDWRAESKWKTEKWFLKLGTVHVARYLFLYSFVYFLLIKLFIVWRNDFLRLLLLFILEPNTAVNRDFSISRKLPAKSIITICLN